MKLRLKPLALAALAVFSTIAVSIISTVETSAISESEMIANMTAKFNYANLQRCFVGESGGSYWLKDTISTQDFSSASSLFTNKSSSSAMQYPEGWTSTYSDCKALFSNIIGSIPAAGDDAGRASVLERLGYSATGGSQTYNCIEYNVQYTVERNNSGIANQPETFTTARVCANIGSDGKIEKPVDLYTADTGSDYQIRIEVAGDVPVIHYGFENGSYYDSPSIPAVGKTWDTFLSDLTASVNGAISYINGRTFRDGFTGDTWNYTYTLLNPSDAGTKNSAAEYTLTDRQTAAKTAASNFLGLNNGGLNGAERISLYQHYIKNYAEAECEPAEGINYGGDWQKVRLIIKGEAHTECWAQPKSGYSSHAFPDVDPSNSFNNPSTIQFGGIISQLNSLMAASWDGIIDPGALFGRSSSETPHEQVGEVEEDEGVTATEQCYGSAGTLGLGWILCPILSGISNALNWFYEDVIQQYLSVEPGFVATTVTVKDENGNEVTQANPTYAAWQTFQNFANIVLVIFLLVVIFSQLTGFGIDNYGIKKILPRLIIGAVLINLSFFIVQFAVDASNIIGKGISNIFGNVGVVDTAYNVGGYDGSSMPENVLGLTVIGASIWGGITLFANPAILLSFLLTILSGLVSVIVMWVILIARKAGVVLAVVVSPLAFAFYMFPNTSKVTKSWFNIMKGLLLVFPLAALLIGACYFASNLISTLGQDMILAAMLLRVVPFLALPTLFKKSVDAIGNIGTKIQGFGQSFGRSTTGAIRSSDSFKTLQKTGLERQNRLRAGVDPETGNLTARGARRARFANSRFGRFFGMDGLQASRVARARKEREEGISDASELGSALSRYQIAEDATLTPRKLLEDQLDAAIANDDTSAIFSAIDQAQKNGMKASDLAKVTRAKLGGATLGGLDDGARKNFLNEFANRYSGTFLKKDNEQLTWAKMGGMNNSSAAVGLQDYASTAGVMQTGDLKDDEVVALSADRLSELITAGIIDQGQAQRVWASDANMDSVGRLILGSYAQGIRSSVTGAPPNAAITKAEAEAALTGRTNFTHEGNTEAVNARLQNNDMIRTLTERVADNVVLEDVRWRDANGNAQQTNPLWNRSQNRRPEEVEFERYVNGVRETKRVIQTDTPDTFLDPETGRSHTTGNMGSSSGPNGGGWTRV